MQREDETPHPMSDPKSLRAAIVEARADFQAAIHDAAAAWDRAPQAGEGDDSWSPRQHAEHAIRSEMFHASAIAEACGYGKRDIPRPSLETPAAAAAEAVRQAAAADNVIRHVQEHEMEKVFSMRGMERTVAQLLERMSTHLNEHATAMRAQARRG